MNDQTDKLINILRDNNPKFILRYDSPSLVVGTGPAKKELNHQIFWSFESYKSSLSRLMDEVAFELKKELSLKHIELDYLKVLYEEFSSCLSSFEKIRIEGKNYHIQKEILIYEWEPDLKTYFTLDQLEDKFKQEILNYQDFKYQMIIQFLDILEKLLSSDKKFDSHLLKDRSELGEKYKSSSKIYSLDQIAEMFHITKRTVYNWKDNGTLPYTQIGSKIYLTQSQLDELLKQHEIKPVRFPK